MSRARKRFTALLGTANARLLAIMLLIPTTRPSASASIPPELPGASRTSAPIHCFPLAWTIPTARAPTRPSGLPTANTNSPTRKVSESPIVATGRPPTSIVSAARSRRASKQVTRPSEFCPSRSVTRARRSLTTCALVMITLLFALVSQITPEPPLPPRPPPISTLDRRRRSAISTIPDAGAPCVCAPATSVILSAILLSLPSLGGPFADCDRQVRAHAAADDRSIDRLANAFGGECRLHIVYVRDRGETQPHQHVADQKSGLVSRAAGLDAQYNYSAIIDQIKLTFYGVRQTHGLHPDADVWSRDAAALQERVHDTIDRHGGNRQRRATPQTRRVDSQDTSIRADQRAAGKTQIDVQIQAHEMINYTALPGAPCPADRADAAETGAHALSAGSPDSENEMPDLERFRLIDNVGCARRLIDLERRKICARVAPYERRRRFAPVVQQDRDLFFALDCMMSRNNYPRTPENTTRRDAWTRIHGDHRRTDALNRGRQVARKCDQLIRIFRCLIFHLISSGTKCI